MNISRTQLALLIPMMVLGGVSASLAQPISVQCSDTLLTLNRRWADTYAARQTNTAIQVASGPTAAVFEALAGRKMQVAIVSRSIRYKEAQAYESAAGHRPAELKVGVVGAAVYVNAGNPVRELTYDELYGIYRGSLTNWMELGGPNAPIEAFGVDPNTPAGELFREEVLGGKDCAKPVQLVDQAELLKVAARQTHSIAFGAFVPTPEGIRALRVKRVYSSTPVEPGEQAISNRVYPISRLIFCYLDPADMRGPIQDYLDWIRGDQGQGTAQQAGFFPLASKWRGSP
jgi:phosphate transport system substrate-binding protein